MEFVDDKNDENDRDNHNFGKVTQENFELALKEQEDIETMLKL